MILVSFMKWEDLGLEWKNSKVVPFQNQRAFDAWATAMRDTHAIFVIERKMVQENQARQ